MEGQYSCQTAAGTLHWITDIINFIGPYHSLINSHVVNFFSHRLWESVDKQWIDCLRQEPVQKLLLIPSGVVQDHWPDSLKQFISTLKSLVLPREQVELDNVFPGLKRTPLNSVLSQGVNFKKRHEVEILSAVVSAVTNGVGAHTIVDVGAGQGYLAQVLSFQYWHPVVAIDACSHHGKVMETRAERIKKHYAAQTRKLGPGIAIPNVPKTITGRVMSIDMLKAWTIMSLQDDNVEPPEAVQQVEEIKTSLVLAGLHACGDLSVTMLKMFSECENVKAVVSIGCCYNLLSEGCLDNSGSECGFPMSNGVKSTGITLGKSSRDLACQKDGVILRKMQAYIILSCMLSVLLFRWYTICTATLSFLIYFLKVLSKYYPNVATSSPSIGRQGKALRRQHQKKILEMTLHCEPKECSSQSHMSSVSLCSAQSNKDTYAHGNSHSIPSERTPFADKYLLFEKFTESGFSRLGLKPSQEIDLQGIWKEVEPFAELVGPYWSLRAALGPLLETLLLLDRLLFLQEQGSSFEAVMLPIFDPAISPRNVAIIAKRT